MGQKIHPTGFRIGILYGWQSLWYANKRQYPELLAEDTKIRAFLNKRLELAGVTDIQIKRSINAIDITLNVARPGVVIGRGGTTLKELQEQVVRIV